METPTVSIVMRAKNEMPYIQKTLQAFQEQTFQDFELVCVDSGSTDGSWELIQASGAAVAYQIAPSAYIPGKVCNEAVQHCHGSIIVFNNADCIPQSTDWLAKLIAPLEKDPALLAVFANQLPRPTAHPLLRKDYERAFGDGKIAATWRHFFSLASCAIRKSALESYPFNPSIQYSEDIEWSWRMKQAGFRIEYVPEAMVEHSHNYTLAGIWKRFKGEGRAEFDIYHEAEGNFFRQVFLPFIAETIRDWLYLWKHQELSHFGYAPVYRSLQKTAVWWGKRNRRIEKEQHT